MGYSVEEAVNAYNQVALGQQLAHVFNVQQGHVQHLQSANVPASAQASTGWSQTVIPVGRCC